MTNYLDITSISSAKQAELYTPLRRTCRFFSSSGRDHHQDYLLRDGQAKLIWWPRWVHRPVLTWFDVAYNSDTLTVTVNCYFWHNNRFSCLLNLLNVVSTTANQPSGPEWPGWIPEWQTCQSFDVDWLCWCDQRSRFSGRRFVALEHSAAERHVGAPVKRFKTHLYTYVTPDRAYQERMNR